jgi:hypothetical protein
LNVTSNLSYTANFAVDRHTYTLSFMEEDKDNAMSLYITNSSYNSAWSNDSGKFPIYIGPDGWVKVGQSIIILNELSSYTVNRVYLSFNTSILPEDAIITSANFSFAQYGSGHPDNNISIVLQSGIPTYPHIPLLTTDFNQSYYSGNGGSYNTSDPAWGVSGAYHNISLTAEGLGWINISDWTKFCLRSDGDIAGIAPVSDPPADTSNGVRFSTSERWGYEPYLYITYTSESEVGSVYLTTASGSGGNVSTPGEAGSPYTESVNASVNIGATADACYHFVNWTGNTSDIDNVNASSTHIHMGTVNKSITANFAIDVKTVTYSAGAGGTVNGSWPENINCGSNSSWVLATNNSCYHFVNWSDASTTNPRRELNVTSNLSYTANFAIDVKTVTYSAGGNGSVNGSWPENVNCGSNSSWVLASPNACYYFVNWNDSSTTNPRRETNVTSNLSFTANFTIYVYNLTTASGANGNVTTPGEGVYPHNCGDVVNLVATENVGYHFVNWTGNTGGILDVNDPTTTITVTANASISANFGIDVTDPAVTTNPATYVLVSSARLNGLLSSDGGEACNVGFEYSLWNGSAWGTAVATANQSKVSGETFFNDLSGLANSSTYRFRALAGNSHTTVYGAYINFSTTTTVYPPTNMLCSPHSTSIDVSWTKGVNSVNTSIRWKTGGYPTDISDGTGLPNQSGGSYSHTGLASGTSYYYRLWGVDGTVISTTNSTLICTTLAPISNTSTVTPPTVPDNWAGAVDDSELAVLPIYGVGNEIADTINVPHPTFWMWSGIGFIILLSIVVYARTKNLFLTVLLATVVMVALGVLKVVPLLTVAIFLLGVFALIAKEWHSTGREAG